MPPEASIAGVRMDGNGRRSESVSSFVAPRILLSRHGALRGLAAAAIVAPMLVGCTTSGSGPATVANVEAPAAFARERLVGRWGVASFHTDKDRPRTEREARAQCSLPYTIAKGPTDGVMMHVADDPKLYELRLKGDSGGPDLSRLRGAAGRPAGSRDPVGDGQSHAHALRRSGREPALWNLRVRALQRLTIESKKRRTGICQNCEETH